jgi:hypothetical protein
MSELSASDSAQATLVLQTFMEASLRHDEATMRACVTRSTLEANQMKAEGGPEGVRFVFDDQHTEGELLVIRARAIPLDSPEGTPPALEMACLMVKEDGQWKFDLVRSVDRMMGGMEQAMEQVATAMGEAMQGVGQALADGLQQAFGGSSAESLPQDQDWSTASLSPANAELLPVPAWWKNLPKTQAAVREALGSRVLVIAAMNDINQQAGSDDPDLLFNWFEDQLFAGWPAMLAQIAQTVPLAGRLRAIRIESATRVENRLLAVDGSDLVYRMNLPYNDGFYQDDQAAALLPGVLAGLPETIDSVVAGFRLMPLDEQSVDLDLYRQSTAPRYMRRISELLRRNVALDVNWDEFGESPDAGRLLTMWGLNRVFGGIAFACLDPSRLDELALGLSRIRIVLRYDVDKCCASYENGVLELGLIPNCWADRGCYEHEIAAALTGQSAPQVVQEEAKPPKAAKAKKKTKRGR